VCDSLSYNRAGRPLYHCSWLYTERLAYRNVGTEPLHYRIGVTSKDTDDLNASWISLEQDSGILFPGQFVEMKVNYASASLYQGTYDSDVTIYDTSQDPEISLSIFHLTMQVYCAALDITQPALVRSLTLVDYQILLCACIERSAFLMEASLYAGNCRLLS
jgi:hypothetical protein